MARNEVKAEGTGRYGKVVRHNGDKVIVSNPGAWSRTVRDGCASKQRNGRKTEGRKEHLAFRCEAEAAKQFAAEMTVEMTAKEAWKLFF